MQDRAGQFPQLSLLNTLASQLAVQLIQHKVGQPALAAVGAIEPLVDIGQQLLVVRQAFCLWPGGGQGCTLQQQPDLQAAIERIDQLLISQLADGILAGVTGSRRSGDRLADIKENRCAAVVSQ